VVPSSCQQGHPSRPEGPLCGVGPTRGFAASGVRAGDNVLVFGAGPIGLTAVLCLKAAGASVVAVSEVAEARKALAREMGIDAVLDPTEVDLEADALCLRSRGQHDHA